MKKLLPHFTAVIFGLFVLGVAGAVLFYSFQGLGLIFPGDLLGQSFGMMLFDLSMFVWFSVFVSKCESTMQYVFAGIGFLVGLAGTLGLVSIEVGLSSGMLEPGAMQKPLTYIFIAVLIGHLILLYAHHAAAPHISASISLGVEKAKITGKAEKDAEKMLTDNIQTLSSPIANDLVRRVMDELNLRPAQGVVLDLSALNVGSASPATDATGGLKPLDFLKSFIFKNAAKPRDHGQAVKSAEPVAGDLEDVSAEDEERLAIRDEAMRADYAARSAGDFSGTPLRKARMKKEVTYYPVDHQPRVPSVTYGFPSQVGKVEMTATNKPVSVVVDNQTDDGGRVIVWEFENRYLGKYANSNGDVWTSFWQGDIGLATRQPQQFSQFSEPSGRIEDAGNQIFMTTSAEEKPAGEDASFPLRNAPG